MFTPPFEVVSSVLVNVAIVLGVWFLINPDLVLRHTALIFLPVAIASWSFSDVPATNLIGGKADHARDRLHDADLIRRVMTVQNLALWVLIAPACMLLALALTPSGDDATISIAVAIAVLFLPFPYLGLAAIVAPLLPFHPMPMRERLRRRDTWLRYGIAVALAYLLLTTPAAIISLGPAMLVLTFVGQDSIHYLLAAILMTPWCIFLWQCGLRIAARIAIRRQTWLAEFLADPTRG
ncbi:MAG TPA: hypothetical protein DCQ04_10650 [Actinobacteria bacterium]|nr:hypothetical protein [Actinomycetota bacterium]